MEQTATMRRFAVVAVTALVAVLSLSGLAWAATSPLAVTKSVPGSGGTEIARTANIRAYFNHDMKASTVTSSTFKIRKQGATRWLAATRSVNNAISPTQANGSSQSVATINPDANLAANTTYQVVIVGGISGVKDLNGNALGTNKSWTFKTGIPPETTLDSGPEGTVASESASFTFSSSKPNSTFQCSRDGSTFAACTSPKSYSNLSQGGHTFSVRAIDASGTRDDTEATRSWTVDTKGPNATITNGPPSRSNSLSATFSFSGAEAGGSYQCKIDAAGSPGTFSACTSGQSFTVPSDGTYTFFVQASDALGNFGATESYTWTVDTIVPRVDNTSPADAATGVAPGANVTATFSEAMDPSSVSSQSFTLSSSGSSVSAQITYDQNSRTATLDPAQNLQAGATYEARISTSVKDLAGNTMVPERTWGFTVEAPPPVTVAPNPLDFGSGCLTTITRSVTITNNTASQVDLSPSVTSLAFSVESTELHIASRQSLDLLTSWTAGGAYKQINTGSLVLKNAGGDVVATSDLKGFVFCPIEG